MKDITVIVTAGGAPGAPGIIKSLKLNEERKIKIVSTDMNPNSAGLYLADKSFIVPSGLSKNYISTMLKISKKENVDVILPLADNELLPLSKNLKKFEKLGVKVCVSKPGALKMALNKWKMINFLKKRGIPVPRTMLASNLKELERAVYNLGYPKVPVCIKPQVSYGERGLRILREDVDKVNLFLKYKPTTTISDLSHVMSILKEANPFPKMMVMEYLPGKEYSVDVLSKNGKVLTTIVRSRMVTKLGISFVGKIEKKKELEKIAKDIVESMGLEYSINLQFRYSSEKIPKIMEINPRVSGTIVMDTASGINMPYLAVKLALGEKIPKNALKLKYGTKMIRYWEEIFITPKGDIFQLRTRQENV